MARFVEAYGNLAVAVQHRVPNAASRPTTYPRGWLILQEDDGLWYRNTGTEAAPNWLVESGGGGSGIPATDTQIGITRLSHAPASAGDPIAFSNSDPRLTDLLGHMGRMDNPHATSAGQIGAATTGDVGNVAAGLAAHEGLTNNPHAVSHGQTSPAPLDPLTASAIRDKHLSNDDARAWDDHRAAVGNPHRLALADIGGVPATRLLTGRAGEIDMIGDLSVDRTIGLANAGVVPGSYEYAFISVDAKGRITAASSGTPSGTPAATQTILGAVKTSSNPPAGTDPVVLMQQDYTPGVGIERIIGTTAPLSGGGDLSADRSIALNANGITSGFLANGAVTSEKHAPDRHPVIAVDTLAARNALGAIRRGQLVYQHDTGSLWESRSVSGTDAAAAVWKDLTVTSAHWLEAHKATDSASKAGGWHLINYNTKVVDQSNAFTSNTYTCPTSGVYIFYASVYLGGTGSGNTLIALDHGTVGRWPLRITSTAINTTISGTWVIRANAGDVFSFSAYHPTAHTHLGSVAETRIEGGKIGNL